MKELDLTKTPTELSLDVIHEELSNPVLDSSIVRDTRQQTEKRRKERKKKNKAAKKARRKNR